MGAVGAAALHGPLGADRRVPAEGPVAHLPAESSARGFRIQNTCPDLEHVAPSQALPLGFARLPLWRFSPLLFPQWSPKSVWPPGHCF